MIEVQFEYSRTPHPETMNYLNSLVPQCVVVQSTRTKTLQDRTRYWKPKFHSVDTFYHVDMKIVGVDNVMKLWQGPFSMTSVMSAFDFMDAQHRGFVNGLELQQA